MSGFTSNYNHLINRAKDNELALANVTCECKATLTGSKLNLDYSYGLNKTYTSKH